VRIITGTARGRPLSVPKGTVVRPTSDRVREALFSALGIGRCEGARVLDLYAGSGALGLEAVSRGALDAVLVEQDRGAGRAITTNIEHTGLRAQLVTHDVSSFLRVPPIQAPFDLVFLDPPYELAPDAQCDALAVLAAPQWTTDDVTAVCEYPADAAIAPSDSWRVHWERRFGSTLIAFLSKEP